MDAGSFRTSSVIRQDRAYDSANERAVYRIIPRRVHAYSDGDEAAPPLEPNGEESPIESATESEDSFVDESPIPPEELVCVELYVLLWY